MENKKPNARLTPDVIERLHMACVAPRYFYLFNNMNPDQLIRLINFAISEFEYASLFLRDWGLMFKTNDLKREKLFWRNLSMYKPSTPSADGTVIYDKKIETPPPNVIDFHARKFEMIESLKKRKFEEKSPPIS